MMGWGGTGFLGLGHLLWWALIIVGAIVLVRWLMRDVSRGGAASEARALTILKERYARGEIDKAEFDMRKRDIDWIDLETCSHRIVAA